MRATTTRKKAMRILWHAGRYLRDQYLVNQSIRGVFPSEAINQLINFGAATMIIAQAYNALYGESHVSGQK